MAKTTHFISAKALESGWIDGNIDGFRFQAKVYDEGSEYGIKEGRVSKLMIWNEAKKQNSRDIFKASILNYDRGWDIKPATAADKEVLRATLEYLEGLPTTGYWEELAEQEPFRATVRLKDGHVINARIHVSADGFAKVQNCLTGNWHGKLDPIAVWNLRKQK